MVNRRKRVGNTDERKQNTDAVHHRLHGPASHGVVFLLRLDAGNINILLCHYGFAQTGYCLRHGDILFLPGFHPYIHIIIIRPLRRKLLRYRIVHRKRHIKIQVIIIPHIANPGSLRGHGSRRYGKPIIRIHIVLCFFFQPERFPLGNFQMRIGQRRFSGIVHHIGIQRRCALDNGLYLIRIVKSGRVIPQHTAIIIKPILLNAVQISAYPVISVTVHQRPFIEVKPRKAPLFPKRLRLLPGRSVISHSGHAEISTFRLSRNRADIGKQLRVRLCEKGKFCHNIKIASAPVPFG